MLLFFSNRDIHNEKMKKIWYALFEESAARRPNWIFHGDELKEKTKNLVLKFQKPTLDDVCLKRFELDPDYKMIHPNHFINDLKNDGIYDKIIDIMKADTNINDVIRMNRYRMFDDEFNLFEDISNYIVREKPKFIKNSIENDFKKIYLQCNEETRKKINGLLSKLMFSYYFDKKDNEGLKFYEDKVEKRNELYDNYKVNELLKDERIKNMDEILKFIFDNQKGNKLFIITFLTAKKIEDKEFMKELENNYGIYLGVDTFIKEMKQKLNEIKNLNELYKFIGSEYGAHKSDLEIIIESYEKAKSTSY
jgi:hypothetical protein